MAAVTERGDYDCVRCGACCRAQPPFGGGVYVRLEEGDEERMTADDRRRFVTDAPEGGFAMRVGRNAQGHRVCAALQGLVGERVACAIYERRPSPCRTFEAGSPECIFAREEAGLPP